MNSHADKVRHNKSQSVTPAQPQQAIAATFQFADARTEAVAQRKLQLMADNYSATQQPPIRQKDNNTGLPDNLKAGIEQLSGYAMDNVRVHRNSDKPAQLQAHAYAQGTDIHIGPGQEKHLPHEAWHVVQQMQGRVNPTTQLKGEVNINDDKGLEKEADDMGAKALQMNAADNVSLQDVQPNHTHHTISNTVQRVDKQDVYKGGAELEYRNGKAAMTFGNYPVTEGHDADEIKGLIRSGIKGLDISAIAGDKALKGDNWALTVETSGKSSLDEAGKAGIDLELILGGPTGSTIRALKVAANAAATAIEALDTSGPLTFGAVGNTIRDNIKRKHGKKDKAKATINGSDYVEPVYEGADPLAQDWSGLSITGSWDPEGGKPQDQLWGLQVTMGVPLHEVASVGKALSDKALTDTSVAKPSQEDVTWSADDILDKWHAADSFTDAELNEKTLLQKWNDAYPNTAYDWESEEHQRLLAPLQRAWQQERTANLHSALDAKVKLEDGGKAAPSLAALNGLASVLAAYVRGMNNGVDQGPKHQMQFVNKNPLPAVIKNAASTMPDSFYPGLRSACVDLVLSKDGGTAAYNWRAAPKPLLVKDWGAKMKSDNVDLVAIYDAAYRSAQIGAVTPLNDVSDTRGEFSEAPIIEFRDLGAKKPSEMAAVFDEIIAKLGD